MRHFALVLFFALIATITASFTLAQKSICVPIRTKNNTIDPNQIPVSQLNMTNRGRGPTYNIAISLCSPMLMSNDAYPCVGPPGYIVAHQAGSKNKTCSAVFNKPVGRPTVSRNGFTTIYGSTLSGADNNLVSLTVVCYAKAPAKLVSRSNKFAMMKNKLGGYTTYIVAYSAVACGSRPPPPPPGPANKTACQRFVRGRSMINPASWQPAVLDLAAGWTQPRKFAFSLCDGAPTNLPSWLPDCPSAGYITRFFMQNETCGKASFNRMVAFRPSLRGLSITYTSDVMKKYMNMSAYAQVNIVCGTRQKGLYSPWGTYSRVQKGNHTLVLVFNLAHPDMCVTLPTTKPAPTYTKPSWTKPSWTKPFPTNWTRPTGHFTLPPRPTNWTRPTWTRPTRHTFFPHPTNWTRPTGHFTFPPRPSNWTRPTGHHTFFPPHPTNWTRPSWTRPSWTRPSNWTRPTGHVTRPHPTDVPAPTKPEPTPRTRPTGHVTFPPRPTDVPAPTKPFPTKPVEPTTPPIRPITRPQPTKPSHPVDPTRPSKPVEPTSPPIRPTKPFPTKPSEI